MIQVALLVHPGARHDAISRRRDGSLDVRVRAPAVDGRANSAVLRLLAKAFALRPRQVRLLRGEHSRQKLVELELDDATALSDRLTPVCIEAARELRRVD